MKFILFLPFDVATLNVSVLYTEFCSVCTCARYVVFTIIIYTSFILYNTAPKIYETNNYKLKERQSNQRARKREKERVSAVDDPVPASTQGRENKTGRERE